MRIPDPNRQNTAPAPAPSAVPAQNWAPAPSAATGAPSPVFELAGFDPRPSPVAGIPTEMPIVVFHFGNPPFLKTCLLQARKTNPNAKIYLLGDDTNKGLGIAEHVQYLAHAKSALAFTKIYRHMSLNGIEFELFCMQRWFMLHEFMVARGIPRCFMMDSDVMLYTDMAVEYRRFYQHKFTVNSHWGGGNSYVTVEGVKELCDIMYSCYDGSDPYLTAQMESLFALVQIYEKAGGISDMCFVHTLFERNPYTIGETSCVQDGTAFDHNIKSALPVWEGEGGIKKIYWKGNVPYCRRAIDGMEVRFALLHFQGDAKPMMERFLRL